MITTLLFNLASEEASKNNRRRLMTYEITDRDGEWMMVRNPKFLDLPSLITDTRPFIELIVEYAEYGNNIEQLTL